MRTPMSEYSSRLVGTVDGVSPDEIVVLLDTDAPQSTALNTGTPTAFPQVNGYVLIPNQSGAIVGLVYWLGIERSPYPKRKGYSDFGLIDLPFPLRKLKITPVGTLVSKRGIENKWKLERGVFTFPSIGDNVVIPTPEQIKAIVTGEEDQAHVTLGTCPSAFDADVKIDPNILFGRHLAILGNTGSGKSCTVASVVRSMLVQSRDKHKDGNEPNARFIFLDPNGEYSKCFKDICPNVRVFRPEPNADDIQSGIEPFSLPAWMWNSSEWSAIAQAAPRIQRPMLQEALRKLKSGSNSTFDILGRMRIRCGFFVTSNSRFIGQGTNSFQSNNSFGQSIERLVEDLNWYKTSLTDSDVTQVELCITSIEAIRGQRRWTSQNSAGYNGFGDTEVQTVINAIDTLMAHFPITDNELVVNEDSPVKFDIRYLPESLEEISRTDTGNAQQFISTLIVRIKSLLNDQRISSVIASETCTLESWLENTIGKDQSSNGQIAVIDLSLIPYEVLHLTIAVAGRVIFEALQRYMKHNKVSLPTSLVLEEAHTFVSKLSFQGDEIPNPAAMCRFTFERIAREGRKFGLGLIVSSQRPSEISESVLSQCNTFMIHRITNDKDQDVINRLVPDTARGLLRELPSLPTRHCIMLGAAVKIPVMIEIPELSKEVRPQSEDPKFWEVWTGNVERQINWKAIADDWQGIHPLSEENVQQEETPEDDVPF
ncbi:MAG: ATPase [Candidatus Cloacimonetes bacterium HGW-Cloacimonetes-3]|jgi:hypothetical protein|nr:MAG: ATPase [Candidatus Cloacimonetes bacterium HGW-Cloacimonetes-3]